MTIHKLKLSPIYYDDSASGIKTFEIRKDDRDFKVGDILELREYVWSNVEKRGAYTGAVHWKVITYILDDEEYLHDGYVCLAVSPIAEPENDGNYEPSNCRFVTPKENSRNRRNTKYLTVNGETKSVAEWCENIDISPFTIYWWIREKGVDYAEQRLSAIA